MDKKDIKPSLTISESNKFAFLLKRAKDLGVEVQVIDGDEQIARLSKDGRVRYLFRNSLPINTNLGGKIGKRKHLTKEILSGIGIRVPKGSLFVKWEDLLKQIEAGLLKFPLVAKPNTACLGNLVIVGIDDAEELKDAFGKVKEKYGVILVEEYVEGEDYRLLVLDNEVIAAARRIAPYVVGDGVKTIQELIDIFNQRRENHLVIEDEVFRNLSKQGMTVNTVLEDNQKVVLRGNANVSTGGIVENVSDKVDDVFKEVAVKAVKELGLRFGGVDIITKDISDSNASYFVTEINSVPGYDLHQTPDIGEPFDPTPFILDAIFKEVIVK